MFPLLLFASACLHINVRFLGGNANCNTVLPFLHFKRLCRVLGNDTLTAEEWMDNGGRAGVCKIPTCFKNSASKPTFGNIHDFQRLTLCCFPVFNWVTNIFILSALPYLLAAAAGLGSTENLCFPSAECLKSISEFYLWQQAGISCLHTQHVRFHKHLENVCVRRALSWSMNDALQQLQ